MGYIRQHASKYYCGLDSIRTRVRFVDKQERRSALFYQFTVNNITELHSIFVKVFLSNTRRRQSRQNAHEKHSLYPIAGPHDRLQLHYTALNSIYDYFTKLNQNEFGAIRVLDYLPSCNAALTDRSNDVKLRQLF